MEHKSPSRQAISVAQRTQMLFCMRKKRTVAPYCGPFSDSPSFNKFLNASGTTPLIFRSGDSSSAHSHHHHQSTPTRPRPSFSRPQLAKDHNTQKIRQISEQEAGWPEPRVEADHRGTTQPNLTEQASCGGGPKQSPRDCGRVRLLLRLRVILSSGVG